MKMQKIKWKQLILLMLFPIAVGAFAALLTRKGMQSFELARKPLLSPPGWLFPVVWTVLYALMGAASYQITAADVSEARKERALRVYLMQLGANFLWTLLFFGAGAYLAAFLCLLVLLLLIAVTFVTFRYISPAASRLIIPYLAWVGFAGYLNWGVYMLN